MGNRFTKSLLKIKESDLAKNIFILLSGNILGYGISFIMLPIISRIFTQSELGMYDLIVSSASIIMPILQMALLLVIMIPREDEKAICICKIISLTAIIGSMLIILFLLFFSSSYRIFSGGFYEINLIMLGLYIIFNTIQSVYYSYTNRKKLYKVLFWNPIIMNISNGILSILLGSIGWGTQGYLLGTLLSYIIASLHMARFVNPYHGHITVACLKKTFIEFKMYPLVQMPANLIDTLGLQLPSQFLGRMFDVATLGGYTMACKILNVPVSLLAAPVNRVYYRTLIEKIDAGENAGEFAFMLFKNNIKIALIPLSILMLFGEWITKIFLGEDWAISGTYITILGITYLLKYCVACLSGTYIAVQKQNYSIITAILNLIICVLCFFTAAFFRLTAIHTIILYSFSSSIYGIICLCLCMHCLEYPIKNVLVFILKYIIGISVILYLIYGLIIVRI